MSASLMRDEAFEAPAAVARLLAGERDAVDAFGMALRATPPRALLTLARGSSDHAAHYAAYLVMARLGRLVTSLPMSLVTLYRARIECDGLLALGFSQSGASPDLVEPMREFAARGAVTAAFVNDTASPLAAAAQWVFGLQAGPEASVAATKSCIAQMAAGARFVAAWQADAVFDAALAGLPTVLDAALASSTRWSDAALPRLVGADRLLVIGRGTGLALAMEAALKLKEVCGLQAEALSGAELHHGPMALVQPGYPVLLFAPRGPAQAGLLALAADLRRRGALVLLAAPADVADAALPLVSTSDADLDPIAALASFYPMVEALARARGRDPDRPPHLAKVTRTR
jgi:glucosamine--fructose-6-phosphate aminotransferase (isomerizing)